MAIVVVEGLNQTVRTLKQFGVSVEDLKEGNKQISSKVAKDAIAIAPRLTGNLASSIKGTAQQRKAVITAGGQRVPYAGPIEYGWPVRNIEARPYLRKAGWKNKEFIIRKYEENIRDLAYKYDLI